MALRGAMKYWRSMLNGTGGGRRCFASSSTIGAAHSNHATLRSAALKGEFAPIYVVMGMVMVAMTIGTHTAKQQLVHSPSVRVNKKRRESIPEVDDPDLVVSSADKFVNKSFLRKVAHVQDHKRTLPDTARPDPFTTPRNAETLKTVGVDPSRH
ncbi:NADH-ubiquinone reductase complex 1 MLRQ subunit [Quillaja saponaria]|uniref:NADH-ubiquinone reductase complex 1 MLRQ subunit n=1 Tax=Quillaja saponaria TaxID=32244 RepID=A0AAD7QEI2_QUISA|nr:NADH-ubiquinone reductase complex 1 MLRQ subunit [Quillaja saponaria]